MEAEIKKNITNKKAKMKNILVYFADPLSEKMYQIWSRNLDLPSVDGCKILEGSNEKSEKVKQYKKVLLFVTMRQTTADYIKEIEKLGFTADDIILFTTQAMETEMCKYARDKGMSIHLLPLFQNFEEFL